MEASRLRQQSDSQLAEIFRESCDDPAILAALNEELKTRNTDEANELHFEVVKARRALAHVTVPKEPVETPTPNRPVRNWLNGFLHRRGLARPDGRALYRYRMGDDEYIQAKKILRILAHEGRLAQPDINAGALFFAYCAEWFRRESNSTFLRWDDPEPDIFPSVPYSSKQQLTLHGLAYWRRELRKNGTIREFLLTVALEGGFPVRILAEGARGWLKDYLRSIMRRAIAWRIDARDEILVIAEEERGRMRKSYQHDDFLALCSELVESLLHLRQKAEAEGAGGVRNSALLDVRHPGWRDELPIFVPPEDEALVVELLTGLLDEKMTGLATEGVEARRYLVKRNGAWVSALQLLADGEIPSAKLPNLTGLSRARAIAAGELGNHVAGEVALLEPPTGEQRRWRIRPYVRSARLLVEFPFSASVNVTLTSPDSVPQLWTWPRGEGLRSDVLVFERDEGSTPQEPLLRFLRSGSVSSPAKTLYVLVPLDWMVEPLDAGVTTDIEDVPAFGQKLVCLTTAAYFRSSDSESISFKIEPDSDGHERELQLTHVAGDGFLLADDSCELVTTPLWPLICEGKKQPRQPTVGELFVRRPGGKWAALTTPLHGSGLMELSWRDPVAKIQIEKHQLALVPGNARIVGIMNGALIGEIRLQGLPGWKATVRETSCVVDAMDASFLSIQFTRRPVYRISLTLQPPTGQHIDVIVPLVGRDAVIALADGSILAPGRQVDMGALRGAVVVAPRKTIIHLTAKGSHSGGVRTVVEGEFPLGVLRSVIDEMLATMPNQDDLMEIVFIGDTRPPVRISRYRQDRLVSDGGTVHWLPTQGSAGAHPVARMILDPREEHALEYSGNGVWQIPEHCKGSCLVYVRDNVDVFSRPAPVERSGRPNAYSGVLISALEVSDYAERQQTIIDALAQVACGKAKADDLKWLRNTITNLNGLPATAFDALKLLPTSKETLIELLLSGRDAGERSAIWSLQNQLPFLWLALPLRFWRSAMERNCNTLIDTLEGVLGKEKALAEAMTWLRNVGGELIALEPALAVSLEMAGLSVAQTKDTPSQKDLTIGYIRDQHQRGDSEPNDLAERLASTGLKLPQEIESKSHVDFVGLFAPVLLAASAREKLKLDRELALIARRTLREDPVYVSASWGHLIKFYGSN